MTSAVLHPALLNLIRVRTRAKLRRMWQTCLVPRRAVLTLLVFVLSGLWLASAGINLMFRDPYEPDAFRRGISLFLSAYFLWHLIRLAWKRPEEAQDWTDAEKYFLLSGPFSGKQLIGYRLAVIFSATLFKASIVTLLLLPDIPYKLLGFIGFLSGLIFLEFTRLMLETVAYGVPKRFWQAYRVVVCLLLLWFSTLVLMRVFGATGQELANMQDLRMLLQVFFEQLNLVRGTMVGQLIEWPFTRFAGLVTVGDLSPRTGWLLGGSVGLVLLAGWVAIRVDLHFRQREFRVERERGREEVVSDERIVAADLKLLKLKSVPRLHGIGPLCWRQMLGVRAYLGSVLMSLLIPGILTLMPLAVPNDPIPSFMSVMAGALFFSFVLLPAALKFDFRRDYDRLSALKMLPVSPAATVWGQLLVPVLIMFAFQFGVLAISAMVRPVPLDWFLATLSILFPVAIFFVALDNLIFLWFPHRLNEEGFEVFLRSILTFTAKVLLLGMMLFTILWWDARARELAEALGTLLRPTFVIGLNLLAWMLGLTFVSLVVHAYRRFDPSVERSA